MITLLILVLCLVAAILLTLIAIGLVAFSPVVLVLCIPLMLDIVVLKFLFGRK